jgi:nucleotide-binding universal stress UspA family protein
MSFKRILAAIDYSPLGQAVFDQAVELAQNNQAELMLFHCLTADTIGVPIMLPGELGLSPHLATQAYHTEQGFLEQQTHQIQQLLASYCGAAQRRGVTTNFHYRCVDPGRGLCQAAQQWGADLIILGRRGRKGLAEAILGSVSNYVLHHASCAVLVIQGGNDTSGAIAETTSVGLPETAQNQELAEK